MAEIIDIKGVGPVLAKACVDNGYGSVRKIAAAMLNDLAAVPGVSEARAKRLIDAAQTLLGDRPVTNGAASPSIEVKAEETKPVEAKPKNSGKKKKHAGKTSDKKKKKKDRKKKKDKKGKKGKNKK